MTRYKLRHIATLLPLVGLVASVAACGKTLVFAERDGINFAIRANATSSPPFEVNFGLERTIATIVPPTTDESGKATGEAVNMLAGFQVDAAVQAQKVGADVTIKTQFASGAAALKVSETDAAAAARIMTIDGGR